MTFNRGKKISKKKSVINEAMQLIESLKKMEEAGALHIAHDERGVHLITDLFWEGKDTKWKFNFCKNLSFLMDRHKPQSSAMPIHIYAIDIDKKERGEYLTSYFPAVQLFKTLESK